MQWFIDNRPEFRESLQKFHYFLRDRFISVVAGPGNNRCRSPTPWPGSRLRCCPGEMEIVKGLLLRFR